VADARADADRVPRRAELAGLLAELRRGPEALERWAEILTLDPEHAAATAAVRAGFDDPELAPRAGAILEPLYEATGRDRELAELLTIAAERESSARERVRLWSRVATIHEGRLSDRPAALTAAVAALRAAVAEPELPETIAVVDRLAGELEREVELIAIYRDVADDVLDSGVQRRLYLDIADLAQAAVGDLELACTYYQRVLEVAPDDVRALGALERIYRERLRGGRTADAAPLYEILARKADLAGADVAARTAALAEMAELAAGPLARPDDAIAAWEQVLEALPAHPQAATALDAMYRRERRWRDLVDLYERRLGFVDTLDEAIALRVKLGELHEHELGDVTTAIESYAAALGGDPGHVGANRRPRAAAGPPRRSGRRGRGPRAGLHLAPRLGPPGPALRDQPRRHGRARRPGRSDPAHRPPPRGAARGPRRRRALVRPAARRGSRRSPRPAISSTAWPRSAATGPAWPRPISRSSTPTPATPPTCATSRSRPRRSTTAGSMIRCAAARPIAGP
jgi:tetratricopeptide (TPR) repeat protein